MEFRYTDSQPVSLSAVALIAITFFLAFVLEFLPWAGGALLYKPVFPLIALIYWVYHQPRVVGYAAAVAVGLLLDLARQTPFGFNVLACSVVVFWTIFWSGRFVLLGAFGQALHVFFILAGGQFVVFVLGLLETTPLRAELSWRLFYPSMTAALLWMLMPILVHTLREWLSGRKKDDL